MQDSSHTTTRQHHDVVNEVVMVRDTIEVVKGGDTIYICRATKTTRDESGEVVENVCTRVKDTAKSELHEEIKQANNIQKRCVGLKFFALGCAACFLFITILLVIKKRLKHE